MRTVKITSKILFYLSRVFAIAYFFMATHSLLALSTGWSLKFKEEGKYFQVCFPFTSEPFLNGDYNWPYIVFQFLIPITSYGFFFLLLSNVFKVFFQPRLFTIYGVKHLRIFYLANFLAPSIALLLSSFFTEADDLGIVLIFAHGIMGVFAYFLAAIFTQGVNLQHEQDLII